MVVGWGDGERWGGGTRETMKGKERERVRANSADTRKGTGNREGDIGVGESLVETSLEIRADDDLRAVVCPNGSL